MDKRLRRLEQARGKRDERPLYVQFSEAEHPDPAKYRILRVRFVPIPEQMEAKGEINW